MNMNHKIGLLLPQSVIYPSINFDLVNGFRNALESLGIADVELRTESIGTGATDKLIYGACEKMLMDGVRIIVGYVNPTTALKLVPLFENGNGIFLSLDAGYHYLPEIKKLNNIFFLSLQGALGSRMVTTTAITDGYNKLAYTGSYYEAGYRSVYAFYKAAEDKQAVVTFSHVAPLKRKEFTLAPLQDYIHNNGNDAVFASYCGDMLQDFCIAASSQNIFSGRALYGSSFMAEEQWLEQCPYPGTDIKVCVPWARSLSNAANEQFKEQMLAKKSKVNIFSLLGWEAGIVAAAIFGDYTDAALTRLEGFTFNSPRGIVQLDAQTHQCHAPMYNAVILKEDLSDRCKLVISGEASHTNEQRKLQENDIWQAAGAYTSWLNAYGCLES